jgi:hypothetical protein
VNILFRGPTVAAIATMAIVASAAIAAPGIAQSSDNGATIALDGSKAATVEGTAGGKQRDTTCAGYIADVANHQVQVSRDSNLRFSLEGAEDATLLIVGAQKQRFCVQADKVSKGKAEIPGRWKRGTYDVFVGSRNGSRSNYKLVISPMDN